MPRSVHSSMSIMRARPSNSRSTTRRLEEGEPQLREHDEFRWVTAGQLHDFDMLPADDPVIEILNDSKKEA